MIHDLGAARMEGAARRWLHRVRVGCTQMRVRNVQVWVRSQNRTQQGLRVGVLRFGEQCSRVGLLNDTAQIHDGHLSRDVFDYGQVVRNDHVGEVQFTPEIL